VRRNETTQDDGWASHSMGVEDTRVSSILCLKDHFLCRTIIVYQGILPERIPITIAAQLCTRPVVRCQFFLWMHLIACFVNLHYEISNMLTSSLSVCLLCYVLIFAHLKRNSRGIHEIYIRFLFPWFVHLHAHIFLVVVFPVQISIWMFPR
jgi:hypothetical protein